MPVVERLHILTLAFQLMTLLAFFFYKKMASNEAAMLINIPKVNDVLLRLPVLPGNKYKTI